MPKLFLLFKCSCLSTPEVDKCIVIPVRMLLTEFLSHRVNNILLLNLAWSSTFIMNQ